MTALVVCLASAATLTVGAILTVIFGRIGHLGRLIAALSCTTACGAGLWASARVLHRASTTSLVWHWTLPMGAFHVGLDPMAAYFLGILFLVSLLTVIYSFGYAKGHGHAVAGPAHHVALAGQLGAMQLLVASMAIIVLARDAILFLMAWEIMSVVSYLLVTTEHDKPEVRRSGFIYLAASHLGTIFIFLQFAWLYRHTGSLDFDVWQLRRNDAGAFSSVAFLFALIGFGTKAGLWPLHLWLPLAHPAAPSPVSAMMSGVLIKMGVFGIVRSLMFLSPPPIWWGALLVTLGALGGVLGILLALAQDDLKRLLAYSSIENIGIVALGLGVGLLGQSQGQPVVAFFGFAGALVHVLNHALLKSLLFQIAGCLLLQTGQRSINALGGLAKRMPITGTLFLVAAIAICGLPPLNGFFGEWMIYAGAFSGGSMGASRWALVSIIALVSLALIGGLTLTCFVKAYSIAFLGTPRSNAVQQASDAGPLLTAPICGLALMAILIGLFPGVALRCVGEPALALARATQLPSTAGEMAQSLSSVAFLLFGLVAAIAFLRHLLLRRRAVTRAPTWGCGYARPTERMQYTGTSFAAPLLATARVLVGIDEFSETNGNPFFSRATYMIYYRDVIAEAVTISFVSKLKRASTYLRVLQQGRIQLYLLYLFGALVIALFWQMLRGN